MSDKNAARAIAHDLSPRCTGGTGHGVDKDCPRYHSRSCENLTNRIAAALERVRLEERERCLSLLSAQEDDWTSFSLDERASESDERIALTALCALDALAAAIRATPESEGE